MSAQPRVIQVIFESAEAFAEEYRSNLAKGGTFIASKVSAELRETVAVDLVLGFCDERLRLEGEVVHIVSLEMESTGATPGVAVQFADSVREIVEQLAPLLAASGLDAAAAEVDPGRRAAPRTAARVMATIDGADGPVGGLTRNISRTGVLVSAPGSEVPVGERVRVRLENPASRETREVDGRVARHIQSGGEVAALGIEFDPPTDERSELERFVEDVQSVEHARQLGNIAGPLDALGPQSLLQMFGNSSPAGTLILRRGEEEGVIGFEGGLMRYVHLGKGTGMKALTRLLSWTNGSFEFQATLEPHEASEAPLPLEAALLEALQQLDECGRLDLSRFSPDARVVATAGDAGEARSKLEDAVLDLARAGFSVQRILDVIPEPDPQIYKALADLADAGDVQLEA